MHPAGQQRGIEMMMLAQTMSSCSNVRETSSKILPYAIMYVHDDYIQSGMLQLLPSPLTWVTEAIRVSCNRL